MLTTLSLIPRPSHHPVFDRLKYAKTGGEGLFTFYHMNDIVCTEIDEWGKGGGGGGGRGRRQNPLSNKKHLRPYLVASAPSAGVSNISKVKNVPLLVQNEERVH